MGTATRKQMRTRWNVTSKRDASGRLCPFIQEPYDDCLCANMNSQNIEAAIYYCSKNFEKCHTYQKWS